MRADLDGAAAAATWRWTADPDGGSADRLAVTLPGVELDLTPDDVDLLRDVLAATDEDGQDMLLVVLVGAGTLWTAPLPGTWDEYEGEGQGGVDPGALATVLALRPPGRDN